MIFYLEDDHLDGMDRGVVNFDVVLLEVEVSRSNVFRVSAFVGKSGKRTLKRIKTRIYKRTRDRSIDR